MMPASASAATCSGVTDSGATVVSSAGSRCARGDQRRQVGFGHRPDQRRVVRALAGDREVRAFEMQAEEARHLLPRRLDAGGDGRSRDLRRVGDQRRQQRRRAERRMRRADRPDALDVGWSLSRTPPPPLTCRSTKPGASMPPSTSTMSAPAGMSPRATIASTTPSLRRASAASSCQLVAVEDAGGR